VTGAGGAWADLTLVITGAESLEGTNLWANLAFWAGFWAWNPQIIPFYLTILRVGIKTQVMVDGFAAPCLIPAPAE
jgi:hypothetical protein